MPPDPKMPTTDASWRAKYFTHYISVRCGFAIRRRKLKSANSVTLGHVRTSEIPKYGRDASTCHYVDSSFPILQCGSTRHTYIFRQKEGKFQISEKILEVGGNRGNLKIIIHVRKHCGCSLVAVLRTFLDGLVNDLPYPATYTGMFGERF